MNHFPLARRNNKQEGTTGKKTTQKRPLKILQTVEG